MAAEKPTNKFKIPTGAIFKDLDEKPMTEKVGPDPRPFAENGAPIGPDLRPDRNVTLGLVLGAAMLADAKVEGITLTVLDRLELARRFRGKDCEIKIATCEAVKKLVTEAYKHAPIISGQALQLLGDEPSDL